MVELKAKVTDHETLREELIQQGATFVGVFEQTDQYFVVPEGRLKLRETKGIDTVELIYYERENIAGPKSDDAFLLKVEDANDFKAMLCKVLFPLVVVEKVREMYVVNGTQVHLDTVTGLGKFIEFERHTLDDSSKLESDRHVLWQLMKTLEIDPKNLETHSYSDLVKK
ncbi:MAG: class IV adenylate cyclase [Candidatus Bathyarchaeia archaeon]|jgi:predicted adenylyl cyclase CyaB